MDKYFSFEGRIRRQEYWITAIILCLLNGVLAAIISGNSSLGIFFIFFIPLIWIGAAQSVKRSHDINNSGWFILIPLYGLWLCFAEGTSGDNQYGSNPKQSIQVASAPTSTTFNQSNRTPSNQSGYNGSYSGGHNSQTSSVRSNQEESMNDGYKSGDLYK